MQTLSAMNGYWLGRKTKLVCRTKEAKQSNKPFRRPLRGPPMGVRESLGLHWATDQPGTAPETIKPNIQQKSLPLVANKCHAARRHQSCGWQSLITPRTRTPARQSVEVSQPLLLATVVRQLIKASTYTSSPFHFISTSFFFTYLG